jgi:SAM-dependent methyltransferase
MTAQSPRQTVSVDDAVRQLRNDPAYAELVRDAYLGRDVEDSAQRFLQSAEFVEVRRLLGASLEGAEVLDVGAGTGIASLALLNSGARRVIALEPDASDEVGRGAIARLDAERRIEVLDAFGEAIPLEDATVDIVYARQLMHHAEDLPRLVSECARVLRPGGVMVACREHVVDDAVELEAFLDAHPIHQLAGGENAYSLPEYLQALEAADLTIQKVLGPWDSIINAFPLARSRSELDNYARDALKRRFGALGALMGFIPGMQVLVRTRVQRRIPGRLYTFLARKGEIGNSQGTL